MGRNKKGRSKRPGAIVALEKTGGNVVEDLDHRNICKLVNTMASALSKDDPIELKSTMVRLNRIFTKHTPESKEEIERPIAEVRKLIKLAMIICHIDFASFLRSEEIGWDSVLHFICNRPRIGASFLKELTSHRYTYFSLKVYPIVQDNFHYEALYTSEWSILLNMRMCWLLVGGPEPFTSSWKDKFASKQEKIKILPIQSTREMSDICEQVDNFKFGLQMYIRKNELNEDDPRLLYAIRLLNNILIKKIRGLSDPDLNKEQIEYLIREVVIPENFYKNDPYPVLFPGGVIEYKTNLRLNQSMKTATVELISSLEVNMGEWSRVMVKLVFNLTTRSKWMFVDPELYEHEECKLRLLWFCYNVLKCENVPISEYAHHFPMTRYPNEKTDKRGSSCKPMCVFCKRLYNSTLMEFEDLDLRAYESS